MRASLTVLACAAALCAPVTPASATSFGIGDGFGTVSPGLGTVTPGPMTWTMEIDGREGGCGVWVSENAGNAAGGFGTAILDCGGTMYGYGVCTATRVALTMTLACPNYSYGGAVIEIIPGIHASDEGSSTYDLRAATAFAL